MGNTVADAVIERLKAWDVHRIFGYSGDGINGFMGALQRANGDPELITARHEEMAAFMASGHSKYTKTIGVCVATQGPGAIHLLNGLYDAKLDHYPVLAIIGQQQQSALGSAYQQEIDLHSLFKDVASAFIQTIATPEQVPMLVDRAIRVALATRGPTCLIFPHDVQDEPAADLPARQHGIMPGAVGLIPARPVPQADALDAAAEVLNAGARCAILIGQGAANAATEVIQVAEILGAGVAKSLLGKPVLSDELPFVTGVMGHLGTTASWELMSGCDTLLMIGTNDPWTEYLPPAGQARGVQIDIDGRNLGFRYPTEVNLVGDAQATLAALWPRLRTKPDDSWRNHVLQDVARWWHDAEIRAMEPADPVNPQRLFWELSPRLPDDAILALDVGSCTYWYARDIKIRAPRDGSSDAPRMQAHLSSTLASMGSAMPYALAAKLAYPDRLVVAIAGDGAMLMNGINELITVADRWASWADPRMPILVLHNNDLNEVTWEMREVEGNPRFDTSQELPNFPFAAYAEMLGLRGIRVDAPEQIAVAWDDALGADRPVVIDAIVDPNVPLLAPHLPLDQARQIYESLAKEGVRGERARQQMFAQHLDDSELPPPNLA